MNSIGKSTLGYKGVIKGLIFDKHTALCGDLYFLLMCRNDNSHRFLIS